MWKDKYKIGVPNIDTQHEELFNRVSAFIKVVQNNKNWDEKLEKVKETMTFMQEYVVFHFDDEEKYQASINYPGIEEHKLAHKMFRQGIENYAKKLESEGFTEDLVQEFSGKLMAWLIMHVGSVDQKIAEYVLSLEDQ